MENKLQKIIDKLNRYEEKAYEGGCGADYLAELGEGFKFYLQECQSSNQEPSIERFVKWINNFSKGYLGD